MNIFNTLFKGDRVIWAIFFVLSIISVVEIYSASSTLAYSVHNTFVPILRHSFFLLLGTCVTLLVHNLRFKQIAIIGIILLLISLPFLALAPKMASNINNSFRWYSFKGLQFQPSELTKFGLIVFSAFVLSKTQRTQDGLNKAFWLIIAVTAAFAILIAFQNLSTAIMLCLVVYIMMILGRVSSKKLWLLAGLVIFLALLFYFLLKEVDQMPGLPRWKTWQGRIMDKGLSVMDPGFRINDDNYQSSHANMAIAKGTFLGSLPGNSTQRDFLPQAYSDFIYAIIIEESGWIGMILMPILYIELLFRALKISRQCTKVFPMLLCMGSALMITIQAFINMLVAVGALPVTGQPMPLVSRGGSSTLVTCALIGIILSVSRFSKAETNTPDELAGEEEVSKQASDTSMEYGV
jgi:cell division protein FtsW